MEAVTNNRNSSRGGAPGCEDTMTACCESREEANSRTVDVLSAKSETKIRLRSVRTTTGTGKLRHITTETRNYKLHILEISESRWPGPWRIKTATELFSGREDVLRHNGVATISWRKMKRPLVKWTCINNRSIKTRLRERDSPTLLQYSVTQQPVRTED